MTDAWHAEAYRAAPIIQTNYCQILLPCSNALFQCPSSSRWAQLTALYSLESGAVVSYPGGFTIWTSPLHPAMDSFATYAVLCAIRLRLCASYHHVLSRADGLPDMSTPVRTLGQCYVSDPSTKDLMQLIINLPKMESMTDMNPNGMVIWHHTCISLTADMLIFDRAAGQSGPDLAVPALRYIREWTKTAVARRACVHAAQAFRAMTDRRVNEGVMFASVPLLFQCGLVLGFYVLFQSACAPSYNPDGTNATYDLLCPVDWDAVGCEGLNYPGSHPVQAGNEYNPTIRFIRGEASVSFGYRMQTPGRQAARLIFLEFAGLLEDVGTRWKVGDYASVLRILSDAVSED